MFLCDVPYKNRIELQVLQHFDTLLVCAVMFRTVTRLIFEVNQYYEA